MLMPILATKLFIPSLHHTIVHRTRLIEQIHAGLNRKVTLVSAPAGFGKTTLLSEWIAQTDAHVAWYSIDERDSDGGRFLLYLIASLQTVVDDVGQDMLVLLQSPQIPPFEWALTHVLNAIAMLSERLVLVLDDYHLIESVEVDQLLAFLIENLPPNLHLMIASREDPSIPLARLRARGQMNELRVADLRFTHEEAGVFIQQMTGITLSSEQISALEARTEGWIAGLQMATLSMQGRTDTARFIEAFTGSHRFVLDYLFEEVLNHQSQLVRDFLLQTSILTRLTGSLCDAVTQRTDSSQTLEMMERNNLFVIVLDDTREWYRYHHLFMDALSAHLVSDYGDRVAGLHRRASDWYEKNGYRHEAIVHALASQDFNYAADLIESEWLAMDLSYQSAMWYQWLQQLPEAIIQDRPILCLGAGWALLNDGQIDAAEDRLRDAEQWLGTPLSEELNKTMTVIDEDQFRALPASIASARAYGALAMGDTETALRYAREAWDFIGDANHQSRWQAQALMGLAQWARGDLITADEILTDFLNSLLEVENPIDAASVVFIIVAIRITRGKLQYAVETCEEMIRWVSNQNKLMPLGTDDIYRSLGDLYLVRSDLQSAEQYLTYAERIEDPVSLPNWDYRVLMSWARLQTVKGDYDDALASLDEAMSGYIHTPMPEPYSMPALKVCIWIRQGRLDDAVKWVEARGLSIHDDIPYLREHDYITFSRVLIAQYQMRADAMILQDAMHLLDRLHQQAEHGQRYGTLIEVLMLKAIVLNAEKQSHEALITLGKALATARPEGYMQVFIDDGMYLDGLLRECVRQHVETDYARQILGLIDARENQEVVTPQVSAPVTMGLLDELSERELEVLQQIAQGYTNPEIAERLYISNNTVKVHSRNIYSKLDVHNRTQAVARARSLGLLSDQ